MWRMEDSDEHYLIYDIELEEREVATFISIFSFHELSNNGSQKELIDVPYEHTYEYMSKLSNLADIFESYYFKENFLFRYLMNIPLFSIEVLNTPLTWQQYEICQIHDPYGGRVAIPSGHGCHGLGERVMMHDGAIREVQDVLCGDLLMGSDGVSNRRVLRLIRGRDELFEIRFSDGTKRVFNAEHTLVLTIGNLTVRDYLMLQKGECLRVDGSRVGITGIFSLGMGDYYGFSVNGDNMYLDYDSILTHNCGKTKLIGVLSTHHLFCSIKSITRIQAPKLEQITKLSFGEIVTVVDNMRGLMTVNDIQEPNRWAFLADFVVFTARLIYVKGFKLQWYIESAVAKKGESNSLSGQHNYSYLLIFDEACGIEDGHIIASMGGLTEARNSCIAFSQHANTTSMFHKFVTSLSTENGGVWRVFRLSSIESPLVTDKALENLIASYNDDEIRVRIEGLYPLNETGNLFSLKDIQEAYNRHSKDWIDIIEWTSRVYAVDIAYKGIRDSSVIVKADLATVVNQLGVRKYFVVVTDIEVYHKASKLRPTEVGKKSISLMAREIEESGGYIYQEYINGVDASSGGYETGLTMQDEAINSEEPIDVHLLEWVSNKRLSNTELYEYINERAKGYMILKETVEDGRFFIATDKYKTRTLIEMEHIPFMRDSKFRYQIPQKKDMGIPSPDILDCFAEIFIMPYIDSTEENQYLLNDEEEIARKLSLISRVKERREEVKEVVGYNIT